MQSELKPCAHCGGEAVMQEPHWRDGNLCGGAPFCSVCGIKTPRYWPKRTGTAIAAWNARASDAEITRLTEALRLQMEAKHKEAAEAKLWFQKAQEWKEALRAAEEREKALRDDACRYHWLRDHSCPPHNFYISVPDEFAGQRYAPGEVDAYIDEAIAALKGPSHDA